MQNLVKGLLLGKYAYVPTSVNAAGLFSIYEWENMYYKYIFYTNPQI